MGSIMEDRRREIFLEIRFIRGSGTKVGGEGEEWVSRESGGKEGCGLGAKVRKTKVLDWTQVGLRTFLEEALGDCPSRMFRSVGMSS